MVPTPLRRALACTGVSVLTLVAACGSGDGGSGATPSTNSTVRAVEPTSCGAVEKERYDPDSLQHVLPGVDPGDYLTDPPTSGPHLPAPSQRGVLDDPLDRPVQVGILERGDVLVQFDPAVIDADEASGALGGLGERVVVAPNPDLPSPVVATAWQHKLRCESVEPASLTALGEFVADRLADAPEDDHA